MADGRGTVTAWLSAHFPDRSVVSDAEADASGVSPDSVVYRAWVGVGSDGTGAEVVGLAIGPDAPPTALWFVRVRGEHDQTMVVFDTADVPGGTTIDEDTFAALPVRSDQQLGMLRWSPVTGQLLEVYVSPLARRRGLARVLACRVGADQVLHGRVATSVGPERTALGDVAALSSKVGRMSPPATVRLPPMTPPAEAVGVPVRLLVPDPDRAVSPPAPSNPIGE